MKLFSVLSLLVACLLSGKAFTQNISVNALTQNSGVVNQGGSVFFEVTVCNTSSTVTAPTNKIRIQISAPSAICVVPATGHSLPTGWSIVSNTGSVIRVCNGTDAIPTNGCRTVLIALQGTSVGGPSTVQAQLQFTNGTSCSTNGGGTAGDNTADNSSTSTLTVSAPTPVTLTDFEASFKNCKPVLSWKTENEENSDRFIIERSTDNQTWEVAGHVAAKGNSSVRTKYQFIDESAGNNELVLYRLKMVDLDASYKYSGIVQINATCKTIKVKVFPNPVRDKKIQVTITGANDRTEARLVSLSGQLILQAVLRNGNNTLNIPNVTTGTYVLYINDGNQIAEKTKITVQN
jgi:hypothetical protein